MFLSMKAFFFQQKSIAKLDYPQPMNHSNEDQDQGQDQDHDRGQSSGRKRRESNQQTEKPVKKVSCIFHFQ